MLSHYLTTALRHFRRNKFTTIINVVCLSLGLTCFLAAHALVGLLNSADRSFKNADRIYAITQKVTPPGSNMSGSTVPITAWAAGEYLQTDFPELEAVARITMSSENPVSVGRTKTFARTAFADAQFFDIFDWPFLSGEPSGALRRARSTVLSESTAIRLFGDPSRAIGKTLLGFGGVELTVTGVIKGTQGLSQLSELTGLGSFDMLVSMDVFADSENGKMVRTIWNSPTVFTYVLLPRSGSIDIESLRARLQSFADKHVPAYEWKSAFDAIPASQILAAFLNALIGTDKSGLSIVALLYSIGSLVLLVSCLNYANLATAQASTHAKEVGLRRVVGAGRGQLAAQYFGEAALLSLLAVPIALAALAGGAQILSGMGVPLGGAIEAISSQLLLAVALVGAVGLLAGVYPALVLCRISTLQTLRPGLLRIGSRHVPLLLVGVQFAAGSFLIITMLIMNAQHRTLERMALARTGDPIVVLSNDLAGAKIEFDTLRAELLRQPHVRSVSASMQPPWGLAGALMPLSASLDRAARRWTVCNNLVRRDYLQTMGLRLVAGRDFDPARANDSGDFRTLLGGKADRPWRNGTAAIIDVALATQNGWTPEQAIGQHLYLWIAGAAADSPPFVEIVGVVETQAQRLVGLGATSNLYLMAPDVATIPIVRLSGGDVRAGLNELDAVWNRLAPNVAIKRRFADEVLNSSLQIFIALGAVIQAVAGLALFIAVLGLIGMSLHIIGRRTHEIGVRKTLGASAQQVLTLLLRDFSKPVLIANLITWPLAFVAMRVYLSIFTQRVGLTPAPFIASLLIIVLVAWSAVVAQASRAARVKPATVLRYE